MSAGAKKPRLRPYRSPKSHAPRGPRIPTWALTAGDRPTFVYDANGRVVGCVITEADGSFGGWTTKTKLGRFATAVAAERAVHKAARAKRASKAKAWELRS
jgi:hypothetical protein